jgi:hypothetical protein
MNECGLQVHRATVDTHVQQSDDIEYSILREIQETIVGFGINGIGNHNPS